MDIREMRYIKEIAEYQTLARAAENLFISQPALTKAVKRIESKLGMKLFKKIGTKNVLTQQGIDLLKIIKPVLNAYNEFEKSIESIKTSNSFINYGVIPYYCTPFTTMFLYNFKNKFPNINVNVIEATHDILLKKLLEGKIDVAMTETPLKSKHIEIFSGFQDDVSVAVDNNNPLFTKNTIVFEDLKDYTFNIVTSSNILNNQIMEGCKQAGFTPKIGYQSSQIGLLLEKTKTGNSVCILNRPMIYDNIVANELLTNLRIIPISPSPQCYCYVSYRKGLELSQEIVSFLRTITEDLTIDTKDRII